MKRLAWAALLLAPASALARGCTPQGRCGDCARPDIASPADHFNRTIRMLLPDGAAAPKK